ncbi:MAG: cell division protein SepF [Erysipelotrichaceae bacterium]|nr:cell division protein SepF [Erysipelotrichaceae bacterium]
MKLMSKVKDLIAPEVEDDEYVVLSEEESKAISDYESPKNKGVSKLSGAVKMVLFEPRTFEEAEDIAVHLKKASAAVVNLHRLPREYSQRTIDFLTGVVFALDGSIQKIGTNVILCAPKSIPVDGSINIEDVGE